MVRHSRKTFPPGAEAGSAIDPSDATCSCMTLPATLRVATRLT